jgi:hypothetical protein
MPERIRLMKEWYKTPEGWKAKRYMWGEDFEVKPDGSFRIDDLEPGKYQISLRMSRTENSFGEDLIRAHVDVTVPPLPPGVTLAKEPVDVGEVPVTLLPRLARGDVATDFTVETTDGKPLKLSDYKGKYVVLKWFWNWSELDVETPALKKAYETMQKEPDKWVLITLGFDQDMKTTKKRVADHQLPGIHARVPKYEDFPQGYMGSPSTVCMIDPDGKVLARNLHVIKLDSEIAKVMLERP